MMCKNGDQTSRTAFYIYMDFDAIERGPIELEEPTPEMYESALKKFNAVLEKVRETGDWTSIFQFDVEEEEDSIPEKLPL